MTRIVVSVMLLGLVAVAHASPVDDARQHYQAGTAAFNLGDFAKAVIEYKAAYTAKQDPTFLYNIAQAARLAGDLPTALFFYKSFLRNMPNAPNKQEVRDRISSLETQIQEQRRPPNETAPPNTLETKPAHPETTTPSQPETPSVVEKPAEPKPETTTTVAPTESPRSEPVAEKTEKTPVYKKWWLWTIVGVVVVGAAVGVGVAVAMSGHSTAPNSDLGNTAFFNLHF